jgi:dipeptidyl aminopeptidase/acylaminoacyl peptidase
LVDLRGHGYSTGDWISYGVRESEDLSQVLDYLQQSGLVEGDIGAYGFSYGAATAIQLASRDDRIRAVVAVAPFSSLRQAAGHLMRTRLPCAKLYVTDQWIDQTLRGAGRRVGLDLREVRPMDAIRQTEAMVLLVHGSDDDFVKPDHSMRLHASAPDRSHVALIDGADHTAASRDTTGAVASLSVAWFNRWLACPDALRARHHVPFDER